MTAAPLPDQADTLAAVAYHAERVRARRLAASAGLTPALALRTILEGVAGEAGLARLVEERRAGLAHEAARRAQKIAARTAAQAVKRAGPDLAPGTWLGWFDGSATPNPGRIGIGALLTAPDGVSVEISRRAGHGNSGEAEYLALIALLEAALPLRPPALLIRGDSRVVIDDLVDMKGAGAAGLEGYRRRARELLAQLPGARLRWVPRHRNGDADRLSQQAGAAWQEGDAPAPDQAPTN